METGNMPEKWEGDFRMVLLDDNGNIVDQYQPCAIVAENGAMMKGTGRRCYVTAPAGTYELSVLFRKKEKQHGKKPIERIMLPKRYDIYNTRPNRPPHAPHVTG